MLCSETSSTGDGDGEDEEEEALGLTGESHQFAIVIDCGSTGSRMFVYRCVLVCWFVCFVGLVVCCVLGRGRAD